MENQKNSNPIIKEPKIVSRKSSEEIPDYLAEEVANDKSETDTKERKFHKVENSRDGVED